VQCVAVCAVVCCGVLQSVAVWRSVVRCGVVCCSVLQCVAVCCNVLQCVAMCCSVVQCVAVCCMEKEFETALKNLPKGVLQCVAVWCSVVQCIAVYCSALQCAAVSVLQCVAVTVCRGEMNLKTALTTLPPGVLQCVTVCVTVCYTLRFRGFEFWSEMIEAKIYDSVHSDAHLWCVLQCVAVYRNSTEAHLFTAVFSCAVNTYCTLHHTCCRQRSPSLLSFVVGC